MRRSNSWQKQQSYQNPLVTQPDAARNRPSAVSASAQLSAVNGGVESMSEISSEEGEEEVGVLIAAKDVALKPLKVAVSKPAQRVYINTALFAISSLFFLGTAVAAYLFLYYNYIPNRGFSRPIHLQYDSDRYPYGSVQLAREIASDQPYDINVILHLPRTQANKHAGNFMLSLDLLAPRDGSTSFDPADRSRIVASSRRPTILPYHSEIMEGIRKASGLVWYLLGWKSESEVLKVVMMEGQEFGRGWRNLPTVANVEVQSEKSLQIYSVTINFTARLRGLRYIMYNYRLTSFITFVSTFWTVAMGVSTTLYAILSFVFASNSQQQPQEPERTTPRPIKPEIKSEFEVLSDTERTFPSTSRDHPLRYVPPKIKKEEEEEIKPVVPDVPAAVEADVEDEDEDMDFVSDELARSQFHDSGIGTSMESGVDKGKDKMRRRTGRGSSGSRERR